MTSRTAATIHNALRANPNPKKARTRSSAITAIIASSFRAVDTQPAHTNSQRRPASARPLPTANRHSADGVGIQQERGDRDAGEESERQEQEAVRGSQGQGHVQGAGGEDRQLAEGELAWRDKEP